MQLHFQIEQNYQVNILIPQEKILQKSMLVSCFSFTEIAKEASKIMKSGSSMLTLTYESTKVIPNYNVMGVCKAALRVKCKIYFKRFG